MRKSILLIATYGFLLLVNSCQQDEVLQPQKPSSNSSMVLVRTNVSIEIGDITYKNVDARIKIKGYDSNNKIRWVNDYNFTGPDDTLAIQRGFHHYSIELVDKWGIDVAISGITANDLWNDRADGPSPLTYALTGSKKAKRLLMYTTSHQVKLAGTNIFPPESRVKYNYDESGLLNTIVYESYDEETSQYVEIKKESFSYQSNDVSLITTTLNGNPYSEYRYEYGNERKIRQKLFRVGTTWVQTFSTNSNEAKGSVNWSFSNGNSLQYSFDQQNKNIINDKTVQSGRVCNTGIYRYDKNINPFHHLGYMDVNLQNRSASNKLKEKIEYTACSFPANRMPVSYSYVYDLDGYPTKKITTYSSGNPNDDPYYSESDFIYEE